MSTKVWMLVVAVAFGLGVLAGGVSSSPRTVSARQQSATATADSSLDRPLRERRHALEEPEEPVASETDDREVPTDAPLTWVNGMVLSFTDPIGGVGRARIVSDGEYKIVPFGTWVRVYDTGKRQRLTYDDDGDELTDEWWFANGVKASETKFDPEGVFVESSSWYENGQLRWYRDSDKDLTWHVNGAKRSEGFYRGNVKAGVWAQWHENGQLESRTQYDEQGRPTGHFIRYYSTGAKWSEGDFASVSGQTTQWMAWYEDGRKREESGFYFDGRQSLKHGIWNEYSRDGTLTKTTRYHLGEEVPLDWREGE